MEQNKQLTVIPKTELNPVSVKVLTQLTALKYDAAAELFRRANSCPTLDKLDDTQLSQAIKYISKSICVITGLKLLPGDSQAMLSLMKRIIPAHYGRLTHDEIVYAFELNSMGKFAAVAGAENGVIHHFQSFNMDYIGKVLSAYLVYRRDFAGIIQDAYLTQQLIEADRQKLLASGDAATDMTDDDFFNACVNDFKKTGRVYLSGLLYDLLVKRGLIKANDYLKNRKAARHKLIGEKAKEQMTAAREGSRISIAAAIDQLKIEMIDRPSSGSKTNDPVDQVAREIAVNNWMKLFLNDANKM